MDYLPLGTSELRVSVVGLAFGPIARDDPFEGPGDENEAIAAVHAGLELGINLIEIMPSESAAAVEETVGKALQGRRSGVVLATSSPKSAGAEGATGGLRADQIASACAASMRRLRTERIDVFFVPLSGAPVAEAMEAFARLLARGDIGAAGLAGAGCERVIEARRAGPVHVVRAVVNLFEREGSSDLLPYCREHRIGVLASDPLCGGLLTGRPMRRAAGAALATGGSEMRGRRLAINLETVQKVSEIADRIGKTVAQVALRRVIEQTGVTSAVAGVSRPTQVREYAGAAGWSLPEAEAARLDELLSARDRQLEH